MKNYEELVKEYWEYMQFLNSVKHPNSSRSKAPVIKKNFIKPILKSKVNIKYLPTIQAVSYMLNDNFDCLPAKGRKVPPALIDY